MERQNAEQIITQYLKPVYSFALKRCKSSEDAEDLSQEIVLRAYRGMLDREDIGDPGKYIWTVAHNALSNYYRDASRQAVGVSMNELAEVLSTPAPEEDDRDRLDRLRKEIAYLSRLQRRIVIAYYFENRKQADIARELEIPVGTVKWHLFEARKELKRGMDTMRNTSELKFNPIRFDTFHISGSVVSRSPEEFFRSALAQNICYCVRREAMSVNAIADALGVSPVYVESEAEQLEEYGFLRREKNGCIANFLIREPSHGLLAMEDGMYRAAAALFAGALYDALEESGLLEDPGLICGHRDRNFRLWALIPWIAACSGGEDTPISFRDVATIRPDGSVNIYQASVLPRGAAKDDHWCGPLWNGDGSHTLWQCDSRWSARGQFQGFQYAEDARWVLKLWQREQEDRLSPEDYAWLAQRGYVKTEGDYDGLFYATWQIPIIEDTTLRDRLLDLGKRVREQHREKLEALKDPYARAVLADTPKHLRTVAAYDLQFLFQKDSRFLRRCMEELLEQGKLAEPTEEQRRSLTTLIVRD